MHNRQELRTVQADGSTPSTLKRAMGPRLELNGTTTMLNNGKTLPHQSMHLSQQTSLSHLLHKHANIVIGCRLEKSCFPFATAVCLHAWASQNDVHESLNTYMYPYCGTIRAHSVSDETMPRCANDLDLSISYCLNASRGDV